MNNQHTRRGETQEGRVVKNKVILNVIEDLQRLLLRLVVPLINNLRGRSHIKYGMTPLFDNGKCVADAEQRSLSIRQFNKNKKPGMTALLHNNPEAGDPRVLRTAKSGMTSNFTTAHGFTARSVIPQSRYAGYSGRTGFTLIELLVVVLIIGLLAAVALPQYQKAVAKSRLSGMVQFVTDMQRAIDIYVLEHGFEDINFQSHPEVLDIGLATSINKWCGDNEFGSFNCALSCSAVDSDCSVSIAANYPSKIYLDLMSSYTAQTGWERTCDAPPADALAVFLCEELQKQGWQ